MPWTSLTPVSFWIVIFIPIFVLLVVFPPKFKLTAILVLLGFTAANLFCVLVVNWSILNYWLRLVPILMELFLIYRFWRANQKVFVFELDRVQATAFLPEKKSLPWILLFISAIVLLIFSPLDYLLLRSLNYKSYPGKPVLLFFPVRYGMYVVPNGGNSLDGKGMNDAYQDWQGHKTGGHSMVYAVDFMKLKNNLGYVSDGILPSSPLKYEGYRDLVFAPCVGTVVYIEDGHADIAMGTPETSLGNRVVLQCYEYFVTVANLKKDSIIVKKGDQINFQDQIGQLGSSGFPSIPHLRVFTTLGSWDESGTPVPQLFDLGFRFLVRNDLLLPNY